MRSRSRLSARLGVLAFVSFCAVAACTGDDEIYAVPKDAGTFEATASSSSSSSGGTGNPDGSTTDGAPNDSGNEGGPTDGGNEGGTDSGTDSGVFDSGTDSGPVVCNTVPCAANATCTALGCGNCNMGIGFCKP